RAPERFSASTRSNYSKVWACANISLRSDPTAFARWWNASAPTPVRRLPRPRKSRAGKRTFRALSTFLDVIAQFGDRAETQYPFGQLRLNRAVGIKRVGHSVDDTGFEHGCARGRSAGLRCRSVPLLRRLRSFRRRDYISLTRLTSTARCGLCPLGHRRSKADSCGALARAAPPGVCWLGLRRARRLSRWRPSLPGLLRPRHLPGLQA